MRQTKRTEDKYHDKGLFFTKTSYIEAGVTAMATMAQAEQDKRATALRVKELEERRRLAKKLPNPVRPSASPGDLEV